MEKFKICPICGKRNVANALECEVCETDLSTVRPTDEETLKAVEEALEVPPTVPAATERVRICEECGFRNPPNERKCRQCGEDISDVLPTEAEAPAQVRFILTSLDGEYAWQIPEGKTVVGREAEMGEYLSDKRFVSRRHAEVTLENGKAIIENLSRTNYTYINNEKTTEGMIELHDGDIIGLGGNEKDGKRQDGAAYFRMRIGSCI